MWWNEDDDILDIIGGAKERLLDANALEAAARGNDDDVLLNAVPYFRVYEWPCVMRAPSISPTWFPSSSKRWTTAGR